MSDSFKYEIAEDFDFTIDEKGSTFIALRKIRWGDRGDYKLDLRKYYSTEEGERMNKGVSFLTEDGPNELTKVLLEQGYGIPKEIVKTLEQNRPDIFKALKAKDENGSEDDLEDDSEYFDPRELLG